MLATTVHTVTTVTTCHAASYSATGFPALAHDFAPAVVGLFAVWLTAHLTLRRSRWERAWDRRAAAYSSIFGALRSLADWCEREVAAQINSDPVGWEAHDRQRAAFTSALDRLDETVKRESWALHENVERTVAELRQVMDLRLDSYVELLDRLSGAISAATSALQRQARKEMQT